MASRIVLKSSLLPRTFFRFRLFIRLLGEESKAASLENAIGNLRGDRQTPLVYLVNPESFKLVPGNPFAYWVGLALRKVFVTFKPFASEKRRACITNPAGDDQRFFRCHWEVPSHLKGKDIRWTPISRGGKFSPFYDDVTQVVDWHPGEQTYRGFEGTAHRPLKKPASLEHFFKPGLTWPLRGSRFSVKILPAGCIFSVAGKFATSDDSTELPILLGLMNSSTFDSLLRFFGGETRQQFEVGLINKVPVPPIDGPVGRRLGTLAVEAATALRELDDSCEVSHAFIRPASLSVTGNTLAERGAAWAARIRTSAEAIGAIQSEIDSLTSLLYGLDDADRVALTLDSEVTTTIEGDATDDGQHEAAPGVTTLTADLFSYALGAAFGRWDIRFAARERPAPELPEPFAALPVCPRGMLQNTRGLPLNQGDIQQLQAAGQWDYSLEIAWDGLLVDDPDNTNDLIRRLREVLTTIWKERADAVEQECCEILDMKDLREYFRKPSLFFANHLKRYSKSRRQAPIYWPLSTASGSYTLWIYYHRLNDDSLYTALNKYVKPKIDDTEKQLRRIESELPNATGREASSLRTGFEETGVFLDELRELRDELARVADLPYKPDLNDGVLITASPLWKLSRLPKWRKDLQECWKKLEAGDYDWAHLAYSIWPDRVRDVCKSDRSIAIAHDLESLCEVAAKPAKKKPSKKIAVEETVPGDEE